MRLKNYLFLIFTLINSVCHAQSEVIKNKQRAILIYNFSQQVTWPNQGQFDHFTIAVLGNDPVFQELKTMQTSGRTVKGKKIIVLNPMRVNDIENIQLVYVNQRLNFDMKKLLAKVRGKSTLVVSEDYGYNQSMINMVSIDDNFQFEINNTRLSREKLEISATFKKMAITSAARWQELYKQSSASLQLEKDLVTQQKKLLEEQRVLLKNQKLQINDQIQQIDNRNLQVEQLRLEYDNLTSKNDRLRNRYTQDSVFQIQLSNQLDSQGIEIDKKQQDLLTVDQELELQNKELAKRTKLIEEQDAILLEQRKEINYQKNFTILFILISLFAFVAGFFMWRSYRIKKKSEAKLRLKNEEIEKQKHELEFQNKEMEEFAYIASHDLQAPLSSMNALAGILLMGDLNDESRESAQMIMDSSEKMRQLIKGLLEYSQLGQEVEFKKVDCKNVVESALENLNKNIQDTGAEIKIGELPTIEGHEVKLILLFQNLIGNALKFRKEDETPLIQISAQKIERKNNQWQFEIKDNGIGIASEAKEQIFAIFQRLHATSEYEGTGIGLAHCKKIVDLHGGKIWVESELDKGSSFFFVI